MTLHLQIEVWDDIDKFEGGDVDAAAEGRLLLICDSEFKLAAHHEMFIPLKIPWAGKMTMLLALHFSAALLLFLTEPPKQGTSHASTLMHLYNVHGFLGDQ